MPNVLVLCFDLFGDHTLDPHPVSLIFKLVSRAAFHESVTVQDAEYYLLAGWPDIIVAVDPFIAENTPESNYLLSLVAASTRKGCTTIFTGYFAIAVNALRLDHMFLADFDLPWLVSGTVKQEVRLCMTDRSMMRTASVRRKWIAEALFLRNVPRSHIVAGGRRINDDEMGTFSAFARVGLGKLGYIGDLDLTDETERIILSMCGLDKAGEALEPEARWGSVSVFDDDARDE